MFKVPSVSLSQFLIQLRITRTLTHMKNFLYLTFFCAPTKETKQPLGQTTKDATKNIISIQL